MTPPARWGKLWVVSLMPDSLVQYVKSVGPRRAEQLNRLGIKTVSDLLTHFPASYEDRRNILSIAELKEGETQTIRGAVTSAGELKRRGGRRMFQAVIKDESGFLRAIWFSTRGGYLAAKFKPGKRVIATGKVVYNRYQRCLEMMHPDMELFEDDNKTTTGGILPIYPLTGGITQKSMRSIINKAIESGVMLPETLPDKIIKSLKLPGRDKAVKKLHAPDENESLDLLNSSGTQARNASYLKQKTLAHWVAMNEMNALLLKKTYPELGDKQGKTDMAGHTWYWIRTTKKTEDKNSRQVTFTVYSDKIRQHNLTRLIAYASR